MDSPRGADSYDQSPKEVERWELSDDEDGSGVHFSTKNQESNPKASMGEEIINWRQWFYVPAFYIYGFVYMAVRILVNVQSVRILTMNI